MQGFCFAAAEQKLLSFSWNSNSDSNCPNLTVNWNLKLFAVGYFSLSTKCAGWKADNSQAEGLLQIQNTPAWGYKRKTPWTLSALPWSHANIYRKGLVPYLDHLESSCWSALYFWLKTNCIPTCDFCQELCTSLWRTQCRRCELSAYSWWSGLLTSSQGQLTVDDYIWLCGSAAVCNNTLINWPNSPCFSPSTHTLVWQMDH